MSKILITGAAGFIGSQLAYRLYKTNHEVTLLDDFSYGLKDNLTFDDHDFNDEIKVIDIRDKEKIEKLFDENNYEYVYHFAGITPLPDCQNNPPEAVSVNVYGTTVILDACKRHNVKGVIFASTSAIYENNEVFPLVEENVEKPSLVYPNTKYMSEAICKAYYDAYHMPIVCLRFANVYGPHIDCLRKQPPVMGYIIKQYFNNESPVLHSTGNQERDFIYVSDLIDLAVAVMANKEFDAVNVSSNTTTTINNITNIIAKYMNKEDIEIKYRSVEKYWDKYPELYLEPYPIDESLLEHEVLKYTCLDNKHAKEKYGWSPKVTLEQGIKNTVEYSIERLKNNG